MSTYNGTSDDFNTDDTIDPNVGSDNEYLPCGCWMGGRCLHLDPVTPAFTVQRRTTITFSGLDPVTHQYTSPYTADGTPGATEVTLTYSDTTSTREGSDYRVSGRRVNILRGAAGSRKGDLSVSRPYPTWLMDMVAIGSEQHYLAQTNGYEPINGRAVEA